MTDIRVSKTEFKAKALELFRQIESSGQSVIVTDRGRPTLEVRPFQSGVTNPLEVLRGSVLRYDDPLDPIDEEGWDAAQ